MVILRELLASYKVILASESPRRRELLSGLDIDFEVEVNGKFEEKMEEGIPAIQLPEHLSRLKSKSFGREIVSGEIIITADTLVVCAGEILGKPKGEREAVAMLNRLSGRSHQVITGITIRSLEQLRSFSVTSEVWFRPLQREEIEYYVEHYKPFDKAGGYGIQEWIGYTAIEKIEGSYFNVVGLPVQKLNDELTKFILSLQA